ncbi:phytanoyl-CoA dioxygenase family protein [Jiulongibacter sediminis]|uniref:Phytanoyl-CoA dioxygenase n=1 Tax=Jiulongibacter sediminis TaxID=1605367 RepID=A0A0P7BQD1_9BACT|nr:phytanoyl-CoA dioxygenase family protein [Jiulongibacter sediminis]KPM47430.1 phytanoyl-CoA dioxygenase [Jiulongibacter sediminis]TBX23009.1 phytanoyl-CoA dioxygenase [Jiulongibacter sediminis]
MRLIDQPYILTKEQIHFYHENKFIKLKNVFDEETLAYYGQLIKDKVKELNTQHIPIEERDTYSKAFLQIFNLWRESEDVKEFIFGKRLAGIATQLMGTEGVRMYHDQALFKEPGGGFTPWHADQYYWPLANDNTITAWIPLQAVPLEMGPLEFSAKSHTLQDGRNLKISDDSEQVIGQKLRLGDFEKVVKPFDLGEVSFHSGWVFHRAGANTTDQMRAVMTVIYMDKNMKLNAPENDNQQLDWDTWCPGAKIGEVIDTEINPVIFDA